MPIRQTRRQFLTTLSSAGAAGLINVPRALGAEGAPEKTTVRLPQTTAICIALGYVEDGLLCAVGLDEIRYVDFLTVLAPIEVVARGEIEFNLNYSINYVAAIDAGRQITL